MFSKFSVQKPYTVAVVIIAVLILGYISFTNMTTDLMPSLDLPYVVLSTSYVGASPEEVEMTVTKPLESGLAAVNNIKGVTSVSRENVSMVILEFVDGTNMDAAMIEITTRLDLIKPNWPSGVGAPIILKLNPDMMPVMIAAVDVKGMDPYVLSDYVENKISPKLEAINGVASVAANGLVAQEVTVTISQTRIDEVNTVILKDVDAELAEVEEKINDGERMLRNAKSQLSSQGKKGIQQIDDMLRSISEGKIQIAAAAEQLKLQREALNGQLAEAQAGESALEQALGALPEPMTEEQKVRIAEIREELNNANSEIASLKSKLETVEKQIAEFTQSPENGSSGGVTMEELLAERDQVNEDIARFQEEKDAIETSSEYIKLSALVGADAQRAGLDAQLAATQAGISQMTIGIAQMDTTISNLEKGVVPGGVIPGIDEETNLNEAEQKLTEARGQARSMISSAAGKITEAQRELGEKRKEFEDARDEALKNAKIDGIISVQMISQMLGAENFQMPAGYITENEQDFLVRVGDKFSSLDGVKDMMLFNLNLESIDEVRLTDVAEIAITDNTATTYAKVNGNNGIMLSFQKQSTFSTADVAASLKEQFQKMMDENPDLHIEALFDQGIYINVIVDSVLENLIYGAILAILVLLIFLGDFRPTVVIAFSIPISVVVAFVLMYFTGITLNVISLAGLALAVGMLVDNSIVVIDNIYRLHNDGMPIYKACVYGAKQMSGAILSSTLTTVCVFLPIVFIQGLARQLFADMGLTIAYSLMASLIVALTLVPAMSSALLKRSRPRKHRIFTGLQSAYVKSLRGALKAKWLVLLLTAGVLVWSVMQLASLGTSFMPSVDSKQMTATLKLNPDSVFTERTDLANKVMDTLTTFDDVSTVGVFAGTSGRAGMSALTGSGGSGSSMTFYIVLKDDKSMRNEEIARAMEEKLAPLNCDITFSTSNMDISMLYGEGIQVEVKGPELNELRRVAADVADIMRSVEGTINVTDGQDEIVPEISIVVDKEAAIAEGLTVAQVYSFVSMTISDGNEVTKLSLADKEYPVIVVDGDNQNLTRDDIEDLYITVTKANEINDVRLGDIATIQETDSLTSISRSAQQRVLSAGCEVDTDHNIGLVGAEIEAKLAEYQAPNGYEITISGESEAINSTLSDLMLLIALAIVLIYLIMVAQFQSFLSPFIVLFTIPLAFTGGFLALILTGMEVSMIAMLGFLVLSGVVVNNGIVFVDSVNQMRLSGMSKRDALVSTGKIRLRPILMTAITTVLGMLTIALGTGSGAEMMQPMAVVTIGGLSYATLMTLYVVPVLYDLLNRRKQMKVRDVDLSEEEKVIESKAEVESLVGEIEK